MIDEKVAIWALASIKNIGSARVRQLLERFGSAGAVFGQSREELSECDGINAGTAKAISEYADWETAASAYKNSIPAGAEFIAITDEKYPESLKNIYDPPPFLYYAGKMDSLDAPRLAIVGSRTPTDYGRRVTEKIAAGLAASGITLISGLAYGIDTVAHKAAIEAGGKTAAIFGCGLDIITPSSNRRLAERIRQNGCLISEFPRGTMPAPFNFPVRNRIISGLSEGVLVVEARIKSGALITARLALEQGRDVLAVPGNVDNRLSDGPNNLIKNGAIPVTSAGDIFENFRWHKPKSTGKEVKSESRVSGDEKTVLAYLSVKPVHFDELIRKSGMDHGKAARALLNMELKGIILRKPGNYLVVS